MITKIDWKAKFSSRKFWVALVTYITSILTAFNVSDSVVVQITTIMSGIGAMIVYILAEAYVDGKREEGISTAVQNVVDMYGDGEE